MAANGWSGTSGVHVDRRTLGLVGRRRIVGEAFSSMSVIIGRTAAAGADAVLVRRLAVVETSRRMPTRHMNIWYLCAFAIEIIHRRSLARGTARANVGEMYPGVVGGCLWRLLGLRYCLAAQTLGTVPMPCVYLRIAYRREGLLWEVGREWFPRIGMPQRPVANSELYERYVFLGPKQDLERLPSHKALQSQGRNGRFRKVVVDGLECVLDSESLPYVRYRLVWGGDEERVVIAAHRLVEGGEFRLVEDCSILVSYFVGLRIVKLAP